ncbi:hypothetical protein ANANG_G00114120 [Anguilla anguilla]|uniref:Uncharacterized protein n=1 Tax=Anguilla anguilla TaxID=7936 RepID=A0A9D3MC96_ANGAN|nr:hypothetical protein ANANG_G00114120 [Anguilla anguilla]
MRGVRGGGVRLAEALPGARPAGARGAAAGEVRLRPLPPAGGDAAEPAAASRGRTHQRARLRLRRLRQALQAAQGHQRPRPPRARPQDPPGVPPLRQAARQQGRPGAAPAHAHGREALPLRGLRRQVRPEILLQHPHQKHSSGSERKEVQ